MGNTTDIEWTHWPETVGRVWNPTRGCSRVSPGCGGAKGVGGCYAERQAYRFSQPTERTPHPPYEGLVQLTKQGPRWTGKVPLIADKLDGPTRWRARSTVFVNSMSDLFHEAVSNENIAAVFGVMAACPQHTFIILTKRAKRMREWFTWVDSHGIPGDHVVSTCAANLIDIDQIAAPWPLPNVVLGVSVENQDYVSRVRDLVATPAACRMISYEPALGRVDFDFAKRLPIAGGGDIALGDLIGWVVVGGESGPGSRPFDIDWARDTVMAGRAAGVPVFVKQLGANPHDSRRTMMGGWAPGDPEPNTAIELRDGKGADTSEWPEDLQVRELPAISRRHERVHASFAMVCVEASGSAEVVGAALELGMNMAAAMRGGS